MKKLEINFERMCDYIACTEDSEVIGELIIGEDEYDATMTIGEIRIHCVIDKVALAPFLITLRSTLSKRITNYVAVMSVGKPDTEDIYEVIGIRKAEALKHLERGTYVAYEALSEKGPLLLIGWGYFPQELFLITPYEIRYRRETDEEQ
ncbi:MAG: hypothetical protein ACXQTD_07470 [Candidatus Syntropharchaeia archaeon]